MKKIIIICLMFMFTLSAFADNISFKMPDDQIKLSSDSQNAISKNFRREYAIVCSALQTSGIVMMALSLIPTGICLGYSFSSMIYATGPGLIASLQMGFAGGMMLYLGIRKASLKWDCDKNKYKYEVSKVLRNIGVITLSSTVAPIGLCAAMCAINFPFSGFSSIALISVAIAGVLALNQLVLGIVFLAVGQSRMKYWKEMMVLPDVSLTHDDTKGFDEGYGLKVGLRITL